MKLQHSHVNIIAPYSKNLISSVQFSWINTSKMNELNKVCSTPFFYPFYLLLSFLLPCYSSVNMAPRFCSMQLKPHISPTTKTLSHWQDICPTSSIGHICKHKQYLFRVVTSYIPKTLNVHQYHMSMKIASSPGSQIRWCKCTVTFWKIYTVC